jgi:uncharacterized protein (TIGR03083 family)
MSAQIAQAVATERRALADIFESLDEAQLRTPSLCDGWTVKLVAAHLTTMFNVGFPRMTLRIIGEQMSFARAVDRVAKELANRPIEAIAAQLRANAENHRHPPGAPLAPLTDIIVHGQDVCRPLGLTRTVPFDSVVMSMAHITSGRAFGFLPAARIRGLRLVATDGDAAWGKGHVIHGPALSLLLAVMGRKVALTDLGGAVPVLSDRIDGVKPQRQQS